jgi:hypothetical protein
MNKCLADGEPTVIAHDQSAEVAEPGDGTFHRPPPLIAPPRQPAGPN